jgi:hypothetical protein
MPGQPRHTVYGEACLGGRNWRRHTGQSEIFRWVDEFEVLIFVYLFLCCRDDGDVGVAVDVVHVLDLGHLPFRIILYYANGIHPHKRNVRFRTNLDRVDDDLLERDFLTFQRSRFAEEDNVFSFQAVLCSSTPSVTECCIAYVVVLFHNTVIPSINEAKSFQFYCRVGRVYHMLMCRVTMLQPTGYEIKIDHRFQLALSYATVGEIVGLNVRVFDLRSNAACEVSVPQQAVPYQTGYEAVHSTLLADIVFGPALPNINISDDHDDI